MKRQILRGAPLVFLAASPFFVTSEANATKMHTGTTLTGGVKVIDEVNSDTGGPEFSGLEYNIQKLWVVGQIDGKVRSWDVSGGTLSNAQTVATITGGSESVAVAQLTDVFVTNEQSPNQIIRRLNGSNTTFNVTISGANAHTGDGLEASSWNWDNNSLYAVNEKDNRRLVNFTFSGSTATLGGNVAVAWPSASQTEECWNNSTESNGSDNLKVCDISGIQYLGSGHFIAVSDSWGAIGRITTTGASAGSSYDRMLPDSEGVDSPEGVARDDRSGGKLWVSFDATGNIHYYTRPW